jgi:hypothetical protein
VKRLGIESAPEGLERFLVCAYTACWASRRVSRALTLSAHRPHLVSNKCGSKADLSLPRGNPKLTKGVVLNPHGRPSGSKNKLSRSGKKLIQRVADKLREKRGLGDATGALLDWVESDLHNEYAFW